jgi:TetR/AcrR family transcriptional repressor of nem operon
MEEKMRYPPDQKAKARAAIIDASAKVLRKNGFNGIGVDGLATAAGVTSGAFYSNFSGKEGILESVIEACLGEPFISTEGGTLAERKEKLNEWLLMYISDEHRRHPETGCVMPTLSADVARASPAVREAYRRKMKLFVDRIAKSVDGSSKERERRAWSIIALMVGGIAIARAMPDGKEARAALQSALLTAKSLID